MTEFKCECCKKVFDLDKAVILNAGGVPYYICEECDGKNIEIRGSSIRVIPSENTCVCCGEVIPEGRQVCPTCNKVVDSCTNLGSSYTVSPKELKEAFERHGTGDALARGFAEGIENPRTDDGFYIDDIDFSSINKLLSIHKIIDDAMEKRDRTVSIFISAENNAVSVNVYPVEQDKVKWIYREDSTFEYKYNFECSNCGMTSEFQTAYCPSCGEQMHGVRRVENDTSTTV